jgi:hypothetical protein
MLYEVNPGERSNLVDLTASPRSEHFHDRDEAENLIGGRVYPTITSSLSPYSVVFASCVLTGISNKRAIVFPPHIGSKNVLG